jgi:hypothetical protein
MRFDAALDRHECGQQADGAGAADQGQIVDRAGARADALDLLPGLGLHAGGLRQHAELAERDIDRDS